VVEPCLGMRLWSLGAKLWNEVEIQWNDTPEMRTPF